MIWANSPSRRASELLAAIPVALVQEAIQKTIAGNENAHCPYGVSPFPVSSAVIAGDVLSPVVGVNVENATYGATICAERTAIVAAVAQGLLRKGGPFIRLITAYAPKDPTVVTPCGVCRQVILEFATPDTLVLGIGPESEPGSGRQFRLYRIHGLLPDAFGPDNVPK